MEITREELIAPMDVVFETIPEEMGTRNETPLPIKIEPWSGGRWFRDLGNNAGHLFAHVQAIKAPNLIEIYGPLFMSKPAISNVQYRRAAEGNSTHLKFCHRTVGWTLPEHRDGLKMGAGWSSLLARVKARPFTALASVGTRQEGLPVRYQRRAANTLAVV